MVKFHLLTLCLIEKEFRTQTPWCQAIYNYVFVIYADDGEMLA